MLGIPNIGTVPLFEVSCACVKGVRVNHVSGFFKMAARCFVEETHEDINCFKENAYFSNNHKENAYFSNNHLCNYTKTIHLGLGEYR